jgi:hypothetical protein
MRRAEGADRLVELIPISNNLFGLSSMHLIYNTVIAWKD